MYLNEVLHHEIDMCRNGRSNHKSVESITSRQAKEIVCFLLLLCYYLFAMLKWHVSRLFENDMHLHYRNIMKMNRQNKVR